MLFNVVFCNYPEKIAIDSTVDFRAEPLCSLMRAPGVEFTYSNL